MPPDSRSETGWDAIRDRLDVDGICWDEVGPRSRRNCFSSLLLSSISVDQFLKRCRLIHECNSVNFLELIDDIRCHGRFSNLLFEPAGPESTRLSSKTTRSKSIEKSENATNLFGVGFHEYDTYLWRLRAFCAALVVTPSCRSIYYSGLSRTIEWQWLAYALFSKRAQSHSSVKRITLTELFLSTGDAEAVAKVIANDTPVPDTTTQGQIQDEREYHVNKGTILRMNTIVGNRIVTVELSEFVHRECVCGVKILSKDNGREEWVDAIVPGVGKCKLPRCSLTQCNHVKTSSPESELALELKFWMSPGATEGLCRLIEVVGPSLQTLRIIFNDSGFRRVLDPTWIISSCPHLLDLTVRNRIMLSDVFVEVCEEKQVHLRHLEAEFDDLRVVARALCDATRSLSKNLQWWLCSKLWIGDLNALKEMLTCNRSLEYLTMKVLDEDYDTIHDHLSRFDGEELEEKQKRLLGRKLAFLSALKSSEPGPVKRQFPLKPLRVLGLDEISTIFEFIRESAVRKVTIFKLS